MSCDNKSLSEYSKNSHMGLPIYFCNVCGMYITGRNEDEIKNKCSEIYKKEYWDGRGAEEAIRTNYSDINSQGKKDNGFLNLHIVNHILKIKNF